jgi:putative membrane-bound dehydrogenase-like protein
MFWQVTHSHKPAATTARLSSHDAGNGLRNSHAGWKSIVVDGCATEGVEKAFEYKNHAVIGENGSPRVTPPAEDGFAGIGGLIELHPAGESMRRANVCGLIVLALGLPMLAAKPSVPPTPPEGVLPVGVDGKPLNLDFETGTLKDWTAEGDAFLGQPVRGDTVSRRRGDMKSRHQGQYWIGGYERHGDKPQGTLTSVSFKVTHPWASFLVGGGPHATTCVELVRRDTGAVFFRASGLEEEDLRPVAVDLQPHRGKEIFIRLVDRHSGHWGHVNFDDFRFHAQKPNVAPRPKEPPTPDVYRYAGLPPEKAAQVMTVPEGFTVKLFTGEPDIRQPIAMCLDDRGRLWVAEAICYPQRLPHSGPLLPDNLKAKGDRILIFEDTDGDGKFDKRTVFLEGLNLVSGLEVGFGGVWIGAAPYLLFVPIKEGEDKPAGPPQVLLDGWGWHDTHETLNSFIWGPDGWLYGCHGVFTHSRVGKPGTPDAQRVPLNAGIWRYHPNRHVFEVFAHGTSNPWGLDFNDYGQAFCEACVIPHCFHIIQGGRYQRQAGAHFNPYTYADIQTIADHLHWQGANPWAGNDRSSDAGGGHAHCGLMVYLGDAWPKEYRNQLFMGNIHGRRINRDVPKPKASGYVASHGPDFLRANDAWARFINMRYGPDGNVYLIDWYDKQACHRNEPEVWDRSNGRIYKICYRGTKPVRVDLQKCSDAELVQYQLHENDWYVRHARRILQERYGQKGQRDKEIEAFERVRAALAKIAVGHPDATRRLRGLWALHVTGGLEPHLLPSVLGDVLKDKNEYVRAWIIQLALEKPDNARSTSFLPRLAELAKTDPSPVVRRYLASGLQRIPLEGRWDILTHLIAHGEDAHDPNLPLLYWYAAEPLAEKYPERALKVAIQSKVPLLLPFMVRRIGATGTPEAINLLVRQLGREDDSVVQLAVLRGLNEALKGRRQVAMPAGWSAVFDKLNRGSDVGVRNQALFLAVKFGDPRVLGGLRELLAARNADLTSRQNVLAVLLDAGDPKLAPVLHRLLAEPALRGPALRGLAAYDDPKTAEVILEVFSSLRSEEKRDALTTLASRTVYAKALLGAVAAKKVLPADIPADVVRQLRNLREKDIDKRISEVWGIVRATPADKAKLIAQYRTMLTKPYSPQPDRMLGRAVYAKICAQCHTLFGVGGKVGPELTGSNRANLDYLLENILDPSAVIPKEYAATLVELKNGRVITGIIRSETTVALTVITANETLTVPRAEVAASTPSNTSMMPDDLLKPLTDEEVRALIGYLQSPTQVPMLATAENAKDFFNGKDLAGWDGDLALWKVENGEIVGRSPGIQHNEFLRSHLAAGDFRLRLRVKLTPNSGNSGVQFRSEALPGGELKGPQADIGAGWWGKLYDENGRGVLWDKSDEAFVKPGEWNEYEIIATGSRIRTFLNGKPCVDLDDPAGPRRGIFGLQIHSGGPMEVRFKDLRLEVNPVPKP